MLQLTTFFWADLAARYELYIEIGYFIAKLKAKTVIYLYNYFQESTKYNLDPKINVIGLISAKEWTKRSLIDANVIKDGDLFSISKDIS